MTDRYALAYDDAAGQGRPDWREDVSKLFRLVYCARSSYCALGLRKR